MMVLVALSRASMKRAHGEKRQHPVWLLYEGREGIVCASKLHQLVGKKSGHFGVLYGDAKRIAAIGFRLVRKNKSVYHV